MSHFISLLFCFCLTVGYSQSNNIPYVILVSFDGFRFDYADNFNAPNFKLVEKKGTRAEGLIPIFPSKTFPNHYSIITGLYAGHHGLVDNSFYDPQRQTFYAIGDHKTKTDPYYYGGKPLWTLARQQGMKSASYFWVGSELPTGDLQPDFSFSYDESVPDSTRINQVIRWLKLPVSERPHFISLYFSTPDDQGHSYGPSSTETKKAVLHADQMLGNLIKALEEIRLPVNVIIVSDHGMEELTETIDTYIFLSELTDRTNSSVKVSNGGTHAHFYVSDKTKTDSLYAVLTRNAKKYSVFKQTEFPKHWHYNTPRAGDIVITANAGFYITDQKKETLLKSLQKGRTFGTHGYDPARVKNMRGIFYAFGPNITAGKKIPAFENIHIYPFIAEMLKLSTPAVDGNIKVLKDVIVR